MSSESQPRRVIVVGCVSKKLPQRAPARDLYTSDLFRMRRAYAERSGWPWKIFSAWYGLLSPEQEVDPYNITFAQPDRKPWRRIVSGWVASDLIRQGFDVVEIHAGTEYTTDLVPLLRSAGRRVELPLEGLAIGRQLAWYKRHAELSRSLAFQNVQIGLFSDLEAINRSCTSPSNPRPNREEPGR